MWKRLNFRRALRTIMKDEGFIERKEMRLDSEMRIMTGCLAPVVLCESESQLLVNLTGNVTEYQFRCTYQSREPRICRYLQTQDLKGKESITGELWTKQGKQPPDHWLPSLPDACQMAVCLKPPSTCLPSLTLSILIITVGLGRQTQFSSSRTPARLTQ